MSLHTTVRALGRAVCVALAVTLVACSQGDQEPPGRDTRPPATAPQTTVRAADLPEDVVTAVTTAGMRVVADDGSTVAGAVPPYAGIDVTEEQLAALVGAGEAGTGTPGAVLDGVLPAEIPMSAFLVGYARGGGTPAAELSTRLLEGQDLRHPDRVVFPALVPLLMAADLAHASGDPAAASLDPAAFIPGNLCTGVAETIKAGINAVFDALHVDYVSLPKTGVSLLDGILQGMADLVVDGVNIVIEAGRKLVIGVVEFLLDEVFAIVGKVAAVAAMVGQFLEYVRPVNLLIEFDPGQVTKGVEPHPNPVLATLTASTDLGFGPTDWPDWFVGCAAEAGVTLPPLKPKGEKVTWTLDAPADLVHQAADPEPVLGEGGEGLAKATWQLETGTEAPGLTGELVSSTATFKADVERSKVRELLVTIEQMARNWLTGKLPGFIRKPLNDAIDSAAGTLIKGLTKATSITTTRRLTVSYHGDDKPKPPQEKHETWSGSWASRMYDGYAGSFSLDLVREGENSSARIEVSGSDCIQGGVWNASVEGGHITVGLVRGGRDVITFDGTISGRQMTGTFAAGAGCGSDVGDWQATRVD